MCQSHTGRLTGLWFLPKPAFGLNTNDDDDDDDEMFFASSRAENDGFQRYLQEQNYLVGSFAKMTSSVIVNRAASDKIKKTLWIDV